MCYVTQSCTIDNSQINMLRPFSIKFLENSVEKIYKKYIISIENVELFVLRTWKINFFEEK